MTKVCHGPFNSAMSLSKQGQVKITFVLFWIMDHPNTSAKNLHENHNKNKRWRGKRLHFPEINSTGIEENI